MNEQEISRWQSYVAGLDFKPLFVTVSGAHIYGFNSPDSDVDLRGCHQLPLEAIVGLKSPVETIDRESIEDGVEVDIVSHDVGKYFRLLVKNNGYVLEQIFSPLIISGKSFLEELRPIADRCITRFHYHHYRGFFNTKLKMLDNEPQKKAKSLLYAYRVLLTGIHLMNHGRVETDIRKLYADHGLDFIPDLIAQKVKEKITLPNLDWDFHRQQLIDLEARMEAAFEASSLPEQRDEQSVNEFLLRLRMGSK